VGQTDASHFAGGESRFRQPEAQGRARQTQHHQDGIDFFEPTTAGIAVGYRWFFLDGGQTTLLRQIGYAANWPFRAKAVWACSNKPTDMAYRF
jgi:hypothetical protein